jgi:mRNA interferase RelE/StbE
LAWAVEFEARANKQLDKLNRRDAARIVKLLDEVAALDDPRSRGHVLVGQMAGLWRYRAGDWRIVCQLVDHKLVVLVLKIGHRREVYD